MRVNQPKFQFGNVVVVDENKIGVIVKTWAPTELRETHYEVYVRLNNGVSEYNESDINHFVYSKDLGEEELQYQWSTIKQNYDREP